MASNESVGNTKDLSNQTIKEKADQTNLSTSLLLSFDDDETDSIYLVAESRQIPFVPFAESGQIPFVPFAESGQIPFVPFKAQSEQIPFVTVSNYNFTKPIKDFNMEISYDTAQDFFQSLGFNKLTIDRLKPYFSALEEFVDYDVFAIIERFEADILANEDTADKLAIESLQDFFQALRLFGFQDEWAQTYTWAMGEAYADQLVKHSIEECIRQRLSSSNTIEPFPDWTSDLQNNQWQTYSNPEFREDQDFFVRKQDRTDLSNIGRHLDEIDFSNLTNLARPNLEKPQYWFHATDWNGAEGILRNGADLRGKNTDFSRSSAYYLNNDYRDSYDFLSQRNHAFRGQHAILIYEFDPQNLADRHYLTLDPTMNATLPQWQQIVFSCISDGQKEVQDLNGCRCVFGWQCANPNKVRARRATHNIPQRRTRPYDSQYAVQLAIRANRMLSRVDDHLIGVVIFQQL